MSSRGLILAAAGLALATVIPGAWDSALGGETKVTSGPAIGSGTPQFDNRGVTGPWKGTKVCYV